MERLFDSLRMGSDDERLEHQRRAKELIYDAWETEAPRDRINLAEKALKLWSDCADAWLMLAEETAASLEQAHDLYSAAVTAGERALGPEVFSDDAGHFWGILETRPYMRARAGLAQVLESLDQKDEAVAHYQDMLRLNPNDNQGVRYLMLRLLIELDRDSEALELHDQYSEDGMAEWRYGRALLAFRQNGDSKAANELLDIALQSNKFVPAYLLGRRRLPRELPEYIGLGDDREAQAYAATHKPLWKQTEGALDWLESSLGKAPSELKARRQ